MGNLKLTEAQMEANQLLADAKTPGEKQAAEVAVRRANDAAADAAAEAKKAADKIEQEKAEAKKAAEDKQRAYEESKKIPVLKLKKDNYVPEPGTEANFHIKVEKKAFNAQTGDRISAPKVQIYAPKGYINFKANCVGLGYYAEVLHDPTDKYETFGMDVVDAAAKKAAKEKKESKK